MVTGEQRRWTPKRKAGLVAAVLSGRISRRRALRENAMSAEELDCMIADYERGGVAGLHATRSHARRLRRLAANLFLEEWLG